MRSFLLISGLCHLLNTVSGQPANEDNDLTGFIEDFFPVPEEDINYEDIYESLFLYYNQPLDLNSATAEEFESLYILSGDQIRNFLDYRERSGKLISLYELQAVPGFDLTTIKKILPFVTLDDSAFIDPNFLRNVFNESDNYFIMRNSFRIEKSLGYKKDGKYTGDRNHLYTRFRMHDRENFSFGFTAEKDAGEKFSFDGRSNGFDYYSLHLQLQNRGMVNNVIIGDYQLQFGQGLVFGAGFSPGKGAEPVTTVQRSSVGLKPYGSVIESGFFRGIGATIGKRRVRTTVFYSYLGQDGDLRSDSSQTDPEEFISSIQTSGLHRTTGELMDRNQVNEQSFGGNLQFRQSRFLNAGVNYLQTHYSTPIRKNPASYNQFEFNGDMNRVASIYGRYIFQNISVFGETALSKSGGRGNILGLVTALSDHIDLSVVFRDYRRDFHSFYGNAFGESSRNINEKGIYWGLKFKPNQQHKLALYYDQFHFPWLKFRIDAPSGGNEYLVRYTFHPNKENQLYLQFRQEEKERSTASENTNLSILKNASKRNILFNADYRITDRLSLKTRGQYSQFTFNGVLTRGLALVQDVNLRFQRINLSGRYALFDTDDFENRQYIYERDALYSFSIPAYHGQGTRKYLMIKYKVNGMLSIWTRYAVFRYKNVSEIGSGQDLIKGDRKSDLRFQARLKF